MSGYEGSLRASASEFRCGYTGTGMYSSQNSTVESNSTTFGLHGNAFIPSAVDEPGRGNNVTDNVVPVSMYFSGRNDSVPTLNPTAKLFRPGENTTRPDSTTLDASAACYIPQPGDYGGGNIAASFAMLGSDNGAGGGVSSTMKKTPVCRFFQRGACRHGLQCTFSHDTAALNKGGDAGIFAHQQHDVAAENIKMDNTTTESLKVIDNGIRSHFGPGLEVLKLELGCTEEILAEKNCKRVLISGLCPRISDFDVEARLSTFGSVVSIHRKHESYAYCTYKNSEQAADAVGALNGTPRNTWSGLTIKQGGGHKKDNGFVSVSNASEVGNVSKSLRNATVKVQWYSPSRVAWLHFHSRTEADAAAKKCHLKLFSGRKVSTKLQRPSWNQKTSFSVWMGGLGESVNKSQLSQFVLKLSDLRPFSIVLEDPPFRDKDGAQIVRMLLLSKGGPLVQFDEDQDNLRSPCNLKRKALARFAKAEDAARVCSFFQNTARISGLGGTKVHCQRVFSAKFTLTAQVFRVVNECLVGVLQSQEQDIRFKVFQNTNSTSSLLVQADDATKLAETKRLLSDIIDGILVLDPACKHDQKIPLWQDCFGSGETETLVNEKVRERFGHDCVIVLFQKRRREVRLFPRESLRQEAILFVSTLLCDLKPNVQAVPIGPERYKFLVAGGRATLTDLITACHGNSVSLDLKNQSLLVEGSPSDARRAVACLVKMMESDGSLDGKEECPVCFCAPGESEDDPLVQLSCFHRYCRDCFLAWLCSGTQACSFPIRCLTDGCQKEVALEELEKVLSRPDFLRLLRAAVDKHVVSNQSAFQFCLSSGCSGIYALPPSVDPSARTATCSTCHMVICCNCQTQEHEGLTCEQSKLAKLPPNRLRNHIVEDILTLKCPRCKQAFLDFDGCFALTCSSCRCGFCGWCLKDCGRDAHPHLLSCPLKPKEKRNETYFGSQEQFEEAQRDRRRKDLKNFLRSLNGTTDKQEALQAIAQDLKDLKLSDVTIQSL